MTPPSKPDTKLLALAESGTVNPHAQDVQDAAFLDSEFFDPRDLVQVRYEMLRRVRTEGQTVVDAASSFGVSRPTFYKAQADFERAGLAGLLPVKKAANEQLKTLAAIVTMQMIRIGPRYCIKMCGSNSIPTETKKTAVNISRIDSK